MHIPGNGLKFVGTGAAVAEQTLTNADLSQIVETSDEWIQSRTGMQERRLCLPDQSLAALGVQAGQQALQQAGLTPNAIDCIILATSTPDDLFGSAAQIQARLKATQAFAFDITAACSGFVVGLNTAAQFIRTGTYQRILLIAGDVLSRWVDWQDRTTCVLFGDGAGAVILEAQAGQDNLLAFEMFTNGSLNHCLTLGFQGQTRQLTLDKSVSQGTYQPIAMNGREVYRFAVARVPEIIEKVLYKADLTPEAVDWLIMHQANQRILDAVGDRLGIPSEKIVSNIRRYGNTSAATIPLALQEMVAADKIQRGNLLVFAGFGAGVSWAASVVRW